MLSRRVLFAWAAAVVCACAAPPPHSLVAPLPLRFEPSADGRSFHAVGATSTAFVLDSEGAYLQPTRLSQPIRLRFTGARKSVLPAGIERLPGVSNYFSGRNPERWRSAVPHYSRVRYAGLYPGVDIDFYGDGRTLEYDIRLAPGADPSAVLMEVQAAKPTLLTSGDLQIGDGVLLKAPVSYQQIAGRRVAVDSRFQLEPGNRIRIAVGAYDPTEPLIIDPVITFSTYAGGNAVDAATAVALDAQNNIYIAGYTTSPNFPVAGDPYRSTNTSGTDEIFIAKLNAAGNTLLYSTYLGGSGDDRPTSIFVDSTGVVTVAGNTRSPDFPREGAVISGDGIGLFVARLSANGSQLIASTPFGGGIDTPGAFLTAAAIDAAGNLYLGGHTSQATFITTQNAYQPSKRGGTDGFLMKLSANLSSVVYSTFLGGDENDQVGAIAADAAGRLWVTGNSASLTFPTTPGAHLTVNRGDADVFVTRLSAAGNAVEISAILSGSSAEYGQAITLGPTGDVYVAGLTLSSNFPTTAGVFQFLRPQFATPGFVARLAGSTGQLVYSTYLGASATYFNTEAITRIAADAAGGLYVAGYGSGNGFPTTSGALQTPGPGLQDGFLARLGPAADILTYATYFGGNNNDLLLGMALDASATSAVLVGATASPNLPVTPGTLQSAYQTNTDAFVAKIELTGTAGVCSYSITPTSQTVDSTGGILYIELATPAGCPWAAVSNRTWAVISSPPAGTGNATITVNVQLNTTLANRSATLTIGGQTFALTQSASPCSLQVEPGNRTLPTSSGAVSFVVTGLAGCSWTAASNSAWMRMSPTSGNGTGQVVLQFDENGTGIPRTGSLTIARQVIQILQPAAAPVPSFDDVAFNHPFTDYIYLLKANNVADFCGNNPANYCPEELTTRTQMAVFLVRALFGDSFTFPANPYFTDVPATHPQFPYIQKLREQGYTNGCNETEFCPNDTVTRGQMAAFIIRTRLRVRFNQTFTYNTTQAFSDVPSTDLFFAHVQKMKELGITSGCTATEYCGGGFTTRGQMAVFVIRALFTP